MVKWTPTSAAGRHDASDPVRARAPSSSTMSVAPIRTATARTRLWLIRETRGKRRTAGGKRVPDRRVGHVWTLAGRPREEVSPHPRPERIVRRFDDLARRTAKRPSRAQAGQRIPEHQAVEAH